MRFHFTDGRSLEFQKYYVQITGNRQRFLGGTPFFRTFKTRYALQGIDARCLARLEASKHELLNCITSDQLVPMYQRYFADTEIRHGNQVVRKNLGSFFAKFVHTFNPEQYCALDNPIRELLGLKRESFFQSFLAISEAYRKWIAQHPDSMSQVRSAVPASARCYSEQMTDLKLLDLIFWHSANGAKN